MWRIPRSRPAPAANEKPRSTSGPARIARAVEIAVEREVCSITVHGSFALQPGASCPLCGHTLPSHAGGPTLDCPPEMKRNEPTPITNHITKGEAQ